MKKLTLKFYKNIVITLLVYGLVLAKIIAQPCGSTYPPASGVNPIFSFSQAACPGSSSPLGINFSGSYATANHQWTISGPNNFSFTSSAPSGCISVPVTGTYYISHSVTNVVNNVNVTNSVSCNINIADIAPPVTYSTVLPSSPIKQVIDTKLPVGTIKGLNSVSLTGAATYSIPIALPSGTKGVEPSLSLEYSSQSGIGLMGFGWNMGIGSAITRVPKDHYHDNYPSPPKLFSDDGLSLDGNRLVLMSGGYGTNNSTYSTKNEAFSRITLKEASNIIYFVVETKSGMKMEYGATNDARIGNGSGKDIVWQLNKVEDQSGNYMLYKYMKYNDFSLLSQVLYTGNSKLGIAPYNSISFDYKSRTDANISYIASIGIGSRHLLSSVTVLAEGALYRKYELDYSFDNIHSYLREMKVQEGNGNYLNSTQFQYGKTLQEFEVKPITVNFAPFTDKTTGDFNGDGLSDLLLSNYDITPSQGKIFKSFQCLPKLKNSNTFAPFSATNAMQVNGGSSFLFEKDFGLKEQINFLAQDYNGDGFDDVPIASYKQDEVILSQYYDHKTDRLFITKGLTPIYLKTVDIYHSIGDGNFNLPILYPSPAAYKYEGLILNNTKKNNNVTGDFDGDSQADYILILSDYVSFKSFVSFPASNSLNNEIISSSYPNLPTEWATADILKSIDFDGDGTTEILTLKDGLIKVYRISKGTTNYYSDLIFQKQLNILQVKNQKFNVVIDIKFGDFNGDQKSDMLYGLQNYDEKGSPKDIQYYVANSSGTEFIVNSSSLFWLGINTLFSESGYAKTISTGDFDGDGMTDICKMDYKEGLSKIDYHVYYSRGISFYYTKYTQIPQNPKAYVNLLYYGQEDAAIGDFNGDGKSEIFYQFLDIVSFFPKSTNHLLSKVVDGYNRTIDFGYENATTNTIYTRGNLKTYPLNSIQTPMYMVSQMSAPDGVGGITSTQYKYEDMKIHRKGLGFLGCGSVTVTNASQGTESYSRFKILQNTQNNKTGYSTVPEYSSEKKGGTLVSETTQDFILEPLSNGRWWLKNNSTTSVNKITGATTISTPIYDTYGNVTEENTDILNVQKSTVSHIFAQHGSWIPSSPVSTTISISRTGSPSYSKTTLRKFDGQGLLTEERDFANTPNEILSEPTYYSNGMLHFNRVSAPKSLLKVYEKETELRYDPNFRFVQEKYNSLKQLVAKITYNKKWGKPLSETDIDGNSVGYQYDGLGRLILTISPLGHSITTDYDWNIKSGNSLFTIYTRHPCKPDTKEYFDILERSYAVETETFASGILRSSQEYDNQGRVVSSVSTTGITTTNQYDALDRLETSTNPIGTTTYAYVCGGGNTKVTITPPSGHEIISTSDATGKVIKKEDNGGILEYKYDSQGNNILVKLAGKPVGTSIFNVAGNRTSFEEPNAGTTTYVYDAYGQLRKQTDSNGNLTTYEYDVLGRTTTRKGKEGLTEYLYKTSQGGLNKIEDVIGFNGINQNYTYDGFGRVLSVTDNGFTHSYGYDPCGNTDKEVYPTGFELNRTYDVNSFLLTVQDAKGRAFFTGKSMDNLGNYSSYTLGNNITSDITYDNYGFPVTFSAGGAQNLRFDFDLQTGNLMGRYDLRSGLDETFTYDNLDRLLTSSKNNLSINYSRNGNIENKTDAGKQNYIYDKTKINAVIKIPAANDYADHIQSVIYTPFHQPDEISEHIRRSDGPPCETNLFLTFTYGADYERRVMELRCESQRNIDESVTQLVHDRRYYNGNYEEDHVAPTWWGQAGIVRKIHYIEGGDGICAMYIQTQIGEGEIKDSIYYVYKDYLGSFLTFTDEKGDVKYEQNFDAWGRYRNIKDWSYVNIYNSKPTDLPRWLYRGFTGHEHLNRGSMPVAGGYAGGVQEFNLINMNGRLYDPINGRMLSVDNYAHDDAGTQGYNRYSYAHNNPLKYSDPDGENPLLIAAAIGAVVFGVGNLIAHAINGDVTSFGKGLKYFGQGAVAGAALGIGISLGLGVPILGTALKVAGISMAVTTSLSMASGIGQSIATRSWKPLQNACELFLGNFYLDENKSFGGAVWEGVSRFSWQLLQTTVGYSTAQITNIIGRTKDVGYFGGATFTVTKRNQWGGVTLGNNIFMDANQKIRTDDAIMQHEYGHYIQSQNVGVLYYFTFGLPSLIHAARDKSPHDLFSTEQDANVRAFNYFTNPKNYNPDFKWRTVSNPIIDENFKRRLGWFW